MFPTPSVVQNASSLPTWRLSASGSRRRTDSSLLKSLLPAWEL